MPAAVFSVLADRSWSRVLAGAFLLGFQPAQLLISVKIGAPLQAPNSQSPRISSTVTGEKQRARPVACFSPDPMPTTLGQRLAELATRSAATDAAAAAALADLQRDGAALAAAMAAAADAAAA